MTSLTIRDLPTAQRPRERLLSLGVDVLSDQELLCCILGRGIAGESVLITAQRLLSRFGDVQGLAQASMEELAGVRGVGMAKAAQLKAAIQLGQRASADRPRPSEPIETPEAAAQLLRPHLLHRNKEHVVALLLDARHRLIRVSPVAIGSLSASIVHPRELFKEAIAASAAAVIVAHNHPSGDPTPSEHDLTLTARLVNAGALLGIEVLDHLILGADGLVSLKALGAIRG